MSIARLLTVAALAAIPCAAFASDSSADFTPGCSGTLTVSNNDGLSLICTGTYALTNATFESNKSITVTASDWLVLQNITLNAPNITLSSGLATLIYDNVSFLPVDSDQSSHLTFTSGLVLDMTKPIQETYVSSDYSGIGEGGLIMSFVQQTTPTVPEPGSFALMALGLGVIGLATRKRIKA